MKKIYVRIISILLAVLLVSGVFNTSVVAYADSSDAFSMVQDVKSPFDGRGMFINCFKNADFPMKSPYVAISPEEQLAKMLDFAERYGYTTIYLEALAYSNAMYRSSLLPINPGVKDEDGEIILENPLKTLSDMCHERGLQIVAVMDPFYVGKEGQLLNSDRIFASRNENYTVTTPDGDVYYNLLDDNVTEYVKRIVEEMVKRYDIDGILIENVDLTQQVKDCMGTGVDEAVMTLLEQLRDVSSRGENTVKLALSVAADYTDNSSSIVVENWLTAGYADCLMLTGEVSIIEDGEWYANNMVYWKTMAEITHTDFVQRISADLIRTPSTAAAASDNELFYELYSSELSGIDNTVISGYTALVSDGELLARKLESYSNETYKSSEKLAIDKNLAITRPSEKIEWSGKNYFIMGTSDPAYPLYYNGNEVERLGTKGTFGILVDVEIGYNIYTFTQNGHSVSIEIERKDPESSATHISKITQTSAFPQVSRGVRAGDTVKFSCIAPSNGYVTASFGGETIELKQVASASEGGIPAVFSAEYTIPANDYPSNKTYNTGAVVYTLDYNGAKTKAESSGELIIVGQRADFIIRTTDYNGNVYNDTAVTNEFLTTLRRGTLEYVESCTDDGYYELRSGGYLPVKSAEVVEDRTSPENTISEYSIEYGERSELIRLSGTSGVPYHADLNEDTLTVTLYNTNGLNEFEMNSSELVKSAKVDYNEEENSTTITFKFKKDAALWGYSVEFDMSNSDELETEPKELNTKTTLIRLSKAPSLSTNRVKPLEGIVVALDAGHGGTDPGALGFGGADGPTEAQLNRASLEFAKARLEQLGATVVIQNQPDDEKLSLEERLSFAMDAEPDIFISLHHNSTSETVDSNESSGTAVYYHFAGSQQLAEYLSGYISGNLNRKNNGAHEGYYYVTRMSGQPSVLVELSYMVNPAEYESTCEQLSLYKTAYAVADAVVAVIRNFDKS